MSTESARSAALSVVSDLDRGDVEAALTDACRLLELVYGLVRLRHLRAAALRVVTLIALGNEGRG